MRKAWWLSGLVGVALVSLAGCGTLVCTIYCPHLQPLVFVDASGAPLTPLRVTDNGEVHNCEGADGGTASPFVTCTGNTLTYDLHSFGTHAIRAEASTGEVFAGDITPVRIPGKIPADGCACGDATFQPITVTLTPP